MRKRWILGVLLVLCLVVAISALATSTDDNMLSLFRSYIEGPTYWNDLFYAFKSLDAEETDAAYAFLQETLKEQGYWEAFTQDAGGFLHLVDEAWPLHALLKRDAIPTRPLPAKELKQQFLTAPAHTKTAEESLALFMDAQSGEGTQFTRLTAGLYPLCEKQLKNMYPNIRLLLSLQGEWDAYVAYGKMYTAGRSKSALWTLMREDRTISFQLSASAYLAREGADEKTAEWIIDLIGTHVSASNRGYGDMLKALSKLDETRLASIFPYFRGFLLEEGWYMDFMQVASKEIEGFKQSSPIRALLDQEMSLYGPMKVESLLAQYGEGGWSRDGDNTKYSVYAGLLLDLKGLDDATLRDGYPRLREAIQANGQWSHMLQAFDDHPDYVVEGSLLHQYLLADKQEVRMRKLGHASGLSFYSDDQVSLALSVYGNALATSPGSELSVDIGQLTDLLAAMDEEEFQLVFEPIERLLTSEQQWLPFVSSCFSRKDLDGDTPLMRGMYAMRDRICRQGGIGWSVETLQAYLGATLKDGVPLYKPENPQPNYAFLLISAENPPDLAKILQEASDGGLTITRNPQEASLIILYEEQSIYAAQYGEARAQRVSAYSTEVTLTASPLAGASSHPVKMILRNDPPEKIEVFASQTEYYASRPALRDTPELEIFIAKILKWGL